jgi:hypothetical protein
MQKKHEVDRRDGYTIEEIETIATNLRVLVTSLHTTLYAIRELEPHKMKGPMKMRYNNLKGVVNTFLITMKAQSTPQQRKSLDELAFENVGLIAEVNVRLSNVPVTQIEWFAEEVEKLSFMAHNKHVLEHGKGIVDELALSRS